MILKEAARKRVAFFIYLDCGNLVRRNLFRQNKIKIFVIWWTEFLDFCLNLHLYRM